MKLMTVADSSQVAEVRRESRKVGKALGMSEHDLGRVAIVATEMATNQLKHAGGGRVLARGFDDGSGSGLELVAFDSGPGIRDIAAAMRDGYSTAGSAGQGLGAMRRQSDVFEIASWPKQGTALLCRFETGKPPSRVGGKRSIWGALCIPMPGEEVCGDGWTVIERPDGLSGMVVDGLGHGPLAAVASTTAVRLAAAHADLPLATLLDRVQDGLRPTRGAAVALFRLSGDIIYYAGIGNIVGATVQADKIVRMVSISGTAGLTLGRARVFQYPGPQGGLIIMHSDGIGTSWALGKYPGLAAAHPSLVAAILFRDFNRGRDDATILVIRVGGA
jgi:anti-sigma regulatory factor (Ser/Thr protein kinase)